MSAAGRPSRHASNTRQNRALPSWPTLFSHYLITSPALWWDDDFLDYRDRAVIRQERESHALKVKGATRRGHAIPLAESPELCKALGASPFVSLYATASAGEDLAELAAWSRLSRLNVPLTVEIRDATGRVAVTVEPLRSPAVQARFAVADAVLARASAKLSQTP